MAYDFPIGPTLIGALLLAFGGLAALSSAMARHHQQIWNKPATPLRALIWRLAGAVMLAGAYGVCFLHWGPSVGAVAWLGLLTVSALGLVFLLSGAPRIARAAAIGAPLLGVLVVALGR